MAAREPALAALAQSRRATRHSTDRLTSARVHVIGCPGLPTPTGIAELTVLWIPVLEDPPANNDGVICNIADRACPHRTGLLRCCETGLFRRCE